MESQLNPNAAVFIPSSPTENSNHIEQPFNENLTQEEFFNKENVMSSSFIAHEPVSNNETSPIEALNGKDDEVWLSSSPKKGGVPLDNVHVPPEDEFDREVSQRPGDLDIENHVNGINGHKNLEDDLCAPKEIVTVEENANPFVATEISKTEPGFDEFLIPDKELQINVNHFNDVPAPVETFSVVESVSDEMAQKIDLAEPLESHDLAKPLGSADFDEPLESELSKSLGSVEPHEELGFDAPVEEIEIGSDQATEALGAEELPKSFGFESSEPVIPNEPLVSEEPAILATTFDPVQPDEASEVGTSTKPAEHMDDADLIGEDQFSNGNLDAPVPDVKVHSPIVSGASDLIRDHLNDNVLEPPSFSHGLSTCDTTSEPLNEGIMYSTSGFDNIMDAVSINPISPSVDQISAQSTPFEGGVFEFHSKSDNVIEDHDQHEERHSFSEVEKKEEFHEEFGTSCSETRNDLNAGFAENEVNTSHVEESVQHNANLDIATHPDNSSSFVTFEEESVQSPVIESFSVSPVPEEKPVEEVSIIPSKAAFTESEVVEDFEAQYSSQAPEIPVPQARSEIFTMDFTSAAPSVPDLCDIPIQDEISAPQMELHLEQEVKSDEQQSVEAEQPEVKIENVPEAVHDLVNGLAEETVPEPDVVCISPVAENVVEQKAAIDVQEECPPPTVSETVPDVIDIVSEPASPVKEEPEAIAQPADESLSQQGAPSVAAAVGVAAVAAATTAAVAATAVASKTEKKPTTKALAAKPKAAPAAKAPLKTATKPTPLTSATAPKKSVVPPVPAARAAPRTTLAPKPKVSDVASKPASTTTKPAPPKPRTTVPLSKPAAEKKPLTNGDAAKPAAAKPLARPSTRPATAPARTTAKPAAPSTTTAAKPATAAPKTTQPPIRRPTAAVPSKPKPTTTSASATETKAKPASTVSAAPRPRPATASSLSSRPAPSVAKAPLASKPIDKQTKETTNKLISATRTTTSRTSVTAASKTVPKTTTTTTTASNKMITGKPAPIRKNPATGATKTGLVKKPSDKPKAPMTNGVKNGHASPDEIPHQNGVSHDEPVIDKKEGDFKIESLVDNQLVV